MRRYRAYVFLRRPGRAEKYLGATMVDPCPLIGIQVRFGLLGKAETGRVDQIQPPDWNRDSEATPTIHVKQGGPALKSPGG